MSSNALINESETYTVDDVTVFSITNNFQHMDTIQHAAFNPGLCIPCALTGEPHSKFRYTNFAQHFPSRKIVYDEIKPALLLASHFLTSAAYTKYWATLLLANREYDKKTSMSSNFYAYRNADLKDSQPDDAAKGSSLFIQLAGNPKFAFECGQSAWDIAGFPVTAAMEEQWRQDSFDTLDLQCHIELRDDPRTAALSFHNSRESRVAQRLRFNFSTTLVYAMRSHMQWTTQHSLGFTTRDTIHAMQHMICGKLVKLSYSTIKMRSRVSCEKLSTSVVKSTLKMMIGVALLDSRDNGGRDHTQFTSGMRNARHCPTGT